MQVTVNNLGPFSFSCLPLCCSRYRKEMCFYMHIKLLLVQNVRVFLPYFFDICQGLNKNHSHKIYTFYLVTVDKSKIILHFLLQLIIIKWKYEQNTLWTTAKERVKNPANYPHFVIKCFTLPLIHVGQSFFYPHLLTTPLP